MKDTAQVFMRATLPKNCSTSPQEQGVPQPPLELPIPAETELIPLPAPGDRNIPIIDLQTAIEQRQTLRRYRQQPLSLNELSYLLWLTQGVKEVTGRPVTLRTVPSAGARHAFETYLLVNNVDGLAPGLYRFAASQHALVFIQTSGNIRDTITEACWNQRQIYNSAVTFL